MYGKVRRSTSTAGLIVTNDEGRVYLEGGEPEPGSVVLTEGDHGTAWQRHFNDGKWHRMGGGRPRTWAWLLTQRRVRLVYDAPPRTTDNYDAPPRTTDNTPIETVTVKGGLL